MATIPPLVSKFTMVGQLEDLSFKSGDRIKYFQLFTEEGEYGIKVAKELRSSFSQQLQPGCWLKVTGMRKYELHKGEVKYKAYGIKLLKAPEILVIEQPTSQTKDEATITKPKAKVLFCQKSTCWNRGGKAACELLKAELQTRGIADRVAIKTTGCLKECEKAPNIVILPDKVRYSYVRKEQVPFFIDNHLLVSKDN